MENFNQSSDSSSAGESYYTTSILFPLYEHALGHLPIHTSRLSLQQFESNHDHENVRALYHMIEDEPLDASMWLDTLYSTPSEGGQYCLGIGGKIPESE
jgi:hypothetical protein